LLNFVPQISENSVTALIKSVENVPFQETSYEIWESKYQLKDTNGVAVDRTIEGSYNRVATALALQEVDPEHWTPIYSEAMHSGSIPAGRILSNAGAGEYKTSVSLINCTNSDLIRDSMNAILKVVWQAGLTLKNGCGIGYCFSTIRHKDAFVYGAGAGTSGPLAFMDIFDKTCTTISSAGDRRGAQMAAFHVSHPDILDFISAKREDGRFRKFNLSILATDDLMDAVTAETEWPLYFPVHPKAFNTLSPEKLIYKPWPITEGYNTNENDEVACEIVNVIPAVKLWDTVMESTYNFSDPGALFIDEINRMNNNWWCEEIVTTNPCGELPNAPHGACLLGSINLTRFVEKPFTSEANFNWSKYRKVVGVFTRMLDNVVEINGLPLEEQHQEITRKRRHGMGYFGLGSVLVMLGIPYGSEASLKFTDHVTRELALEGWRQALILAKEKGPAPIMLEEFEVTAKMLKQKPQMVQDGYQIGDKVPGRILHARYSEYMHRIATVEPELVEELALVGARFTHHSSIAPTGTIAFSVGNNASNGIEPSFSHAYPRNVIKKGRKTRQQMEVMSFEYAAYKWLVNPAATVADLPEIFVNADDIPPQDHLRVQAAAQYWIDASISKTVNVPEDYPYEDFKGLYRLAYDLKLKGCATYRHNPAVSQGVLLKTGSQGKTHYCFDLANGESVTVPGDQTIFYDGENHVAANLYEALKNDQYGKL
jgi:ribonucleoside-diphosphate reductase alpha chain